MSWGFSFQLLPEEVVIEDSVKGSRPGLKPVYSVFLTNRRVIFRFDGLGSSLTQSFFYDEVLDVKTCKRFFVSYLDVKTAKKNFLLNTGDADYWSKKILEMKNNLAGLSAPKEPTVSPSAGKIKGELSDMLMALRRYSLLTEKELEDKLRMLDSMKL